MTSPAVGSVGWFEGIEGVVRVHCATPAPGHVTLDIRPGSEGLVDVLNEDGGVPGSGILPLGMIVHEQVVR